MLVRIQHRGIKTHRRGILPTQAASEEVTSKSGAYPTFTWRSNFWQSVDERLTLLCTFLPIHSNEICLLWLFFSSREWNKFSFYLMCSDIYIFSFSLYIKLQGFVEILVIIFIRTSNFIAHFSRDTYLLILPINTGNKMIFE